MSVTLLAFGRRGYAAAATNMVASLRHAGYKGRIHLFVGAPLRPHIPSFTAQECIMHDLPDHLTADPGWCKINLPVLVQEPTLYLDVDGIVLKDITPLLDALKADGRHYITKVFGSGKDGEQIEYFEWATTKTVRYLEGFGPDATYYGIQSSWAWMVPGDALAHMHKIMVSSWQSWKVSDLKFAWGGSMPDELLYSIACTATDHNPAWHEEVAFWGVGFTPWKEVKEKYYLMTLHGSGRGRGTVPPRYVDQYDHYMRSVFKAMGMHPPFAASVIRKDKWVDHAKTNSHALQHLR